MRLENTTLCCSRLYSHRSGADLVKPIAQPDNVCPAIVSGLPPGFQWMLPIFERQIHS